MFFISLFGFIFSACAVCGIFGLYYFWKPPNAKMAPKRLEE